jgi:hypothetical protein
MVVFHSDSIVLEFHLFFRIRIIPGVQHKTHRIVIMHLFIIHF